MFGRKNEGGLMDVIRCDEPEYLIWKWRPAGAALNSTSKENSIRFGSRLQVKSGEVAVFVHEKGQDYIEGEFTQKLETSNFPVLASIMGAAFNGQAPFRAEVYFINLAGIIQIPIGVPWFKVFDPRFLDFGVPVAVRGTLSFKITDYKEFIKLNQMRNFDMETFRNQVRDAIVKYVRGVVTNIPQNFGIPVVQLGNRVLEINEIVANHLRPSLEGDFGVTINRVDIADVELDKESEAWHELRKVTANVTTKTTLAQADTNIRNMEDMQRINAANMEDSLRIQREESQHAQRMQTDSANFALHQLNQQTRVAMAGADALGKMGAGGAMNMGGGGMNPAGMMTGMMMGGAVGGQMAGMMGNMMQGVQQPMQPPPQQPGMPPAGAPPAAPPPPPVMQFQVAVNGQTTGPFDMNTLAQMVQTGQLTPQSQVWNQGMSGWAAAGTVQELSALFAAGASAPPPPPPPPPAS